MARKRMIDPEYWAKEDIARWSFQARLFYIALWNFADDKGRLRAHPGLLKSQVFPYDPFEKVNIAELKKELSNKVQWYSIDDSDYGWIRNFLDHQRIDRPSDSKIPKPPAEKEQFDDSSKNESRTSPANLKEVKGKEEKLREEKKTKDLSSSQVQQVLDLLYELTKRRYGNTQPNAKFIIARMGEHNLDDCLLVIRFMCKKWGKPAWKGATDMRQYLRPSTLFQASKFEGYLNDAKNDDGKKSEDATKKDLEKLTRIQKEMRSKKKKNDKGREIF